MKTTTRRTFVLGGIAAGLSFALATPALAADDFPSRPIRLIVPYTPGGGVDSLARVLSKVLADTRKVNVIVENKPGGGTVIGSDNVAQSAPDGYTILLNSSAHAINATLVPKLPYSTEKSFAPIALAGRAPSVLVVRPDSPFKTVQDIVAKAKAEPGKLTYGSAGNGTSVHLAGELLKQAAGVEITHVPYRGAGPSINDLLGGQIDMVFGTAGAVSGHVQQGRLRAVATTTPTRSPAWASVPTIAETFPGYAGDVWYALLAPAGTPPAVLAKLNKLFNEAIASDEFKNRTSSEGIVGGAMSPEELGRFIDSEIVRWRKVIQTGNITAG